MGSLTLADKQRDITQAQMAAFAIIPELIVRSDMGHEELGVGDKFSLAGLEIRSIAFKGKRIISPVDKGDERKTK